MYRFLIVDDEPIIRKGLEKLIVQLSPSAVMTETAENGAEAYEKIKRMKPDFVFTDIRMPRMDGLELCHKIRESNFQMEVVVVTGYSDFEYAQKCVSYGVKEYILKPVTKTGMTNVIHKLIACSESKQQAVFIPIAEQERWLKELEDAVWILNEEAACEAVRNVKSYCAKQGIFTDQLRMVIEDLLAQLVRSLNKRDIYQFPAAPSIEQSMTKEGDPFEWLEQQLEELLQLIRNKRKGNAKDPVEEVKLYIENNLSRELTLEDAAQRLGLNPSYFSQLFKQMTDETFVQYRIRRKMEKAKKLLAIPHYKITDVSYEVGYSDHPHFTKTFKKNTGYTPSEYRALLGIE